MRNGSIIMLSLSFGESHQLAEVDEGKIKADSQHPYYLA